MSKRRFSSPPPTNKPKEQAKPDDKPGKAYWSNTPNGPVKTYTREEIAAYLKQRRSGR